jgi:hypothetical protein
MINCLAPEILNKSGITDKSDVYSLGMVLIEMLSLEIPFDEIHSQLTIREKIIDGLKPITMEKISDLTIIKLLNKLLEYDPKSRPSILQLLNEDFLKINEKEDNRIVQIIKLKKKPKRLLTSKNTSNSLLNNNYITTPYQSAVPDDYVMSSSNQIIRKYSKKCVNKHIKSFFNNQNSNVNQRLNKNNFCNSNKNNFSHTTNNLSNLNVNSTMNNLHDSSHERHKRPAMHNMSKKMNKKKLLLFKHNFKENLYFEESLKLKMENEFENTQNLINNYNQDQQQQVQSNNKSFEYSTIISKVNKDPTYFLNQNNLNTNDQIKEYLDIKSNNINKINRSSIELEENLRNKNYLRPEELDILSGLENNLEKRANKNNITNSHEALMHITEFIQTYPDNLSAIQTNYNRETLCNEYSQAHTNKYSNNTISGIIENNLNYNSHNLNINFHNSCENKNNGFNNLTPKSNCNSEMIFSKNFSQSRKEDDNSKNSNMNNINNYIDNTDKSEIKKKINKSVCWMNFNDKIYDVIDTHIKNDLYEGKNIENFINQEKDLNKNPQYDSSENLNQIVEKKKSNNFDPIFNKSEIPNEIKNDFNSVSNINDNKYTNKEDYILHESNSHINNGFMKYSKESSSLIDSDNLLDNNYDSNKNNLIIHNLSNISSNKNIENIVKNNNSSINNNQHKNAIKTSNSQANLRSNLFENKNLNLQTEQNFRRKCESTNNILYYNSIKPEYNEDLELLINDQELNFNESKETETKKSNHNNVNGFNSCYNVRNSSSDNLMHLNALQGRKHFADEEEEYANLANKDAIDDFRENNNNINNISSKPKYQIFDSNYDVHLKFMINQDSKIHEIQFT